MCHSALVVGTLRRLPRTATLEIICTYEVTIDVTTSDNKTQHASLRREAGFCREEPTIGGEPSTEMISGQKGELVMLIVSDETLRPSNVSDACKEAITCSTALPGFVCEHVKSILQITETNEILINCANFVKAAPIPTVRAHRDKDREIERTFVT